MPFLVVTVEGALRAADIRYEEAAATLGAGRLAVLRRVTLPMVVPSVAAGAALLGRAHWVSSGHDHLRRATCPG